MDQIIANYVRSSAVPALDILAMLYTLVIVEVL